ncbi:MAG: hypothetical protein O2951_12580 [Bacteroidetes bacterium]|nr:hypothetical protein [Bacteroidota bacterium]
MKTANSSLYQEPLVGREKNDDHRLFKQESPHFLFPLTVPRIKVKKLLPKSLFLFI